MAFNRKSIFQWCEWIYSTRCSEMSSCANEWSSSSPTCVPSSSLLSRVNHRLVDRMISKSSREWRWCALDGCTNALRTTGCRWSNVECLCGYSFWLASVCRQHRHQQPPSSSLTLALLQFRLRSHFRSWAVDVRTVSILVWQWQRRRQNLDELAYRWCESSATIILDTIDHFHHHQSIRITSHQSCPYFV